MAVDEKLVRKGIDEPRDGLVEQGKASAELAKRNEAELAKTNWPAEKTQALLAGVAELESDVAKQVEARREAESAGGAKEIAIDRSKGFIRILRLALPECLQTTAVTGITMKSFAVDGGALRRSPRKISAYLLKIRPHVEALDEDLKPYFDNVAPSTLLDACKTELDVSNAVRKVEVAEIPEATAKIYERKGFVLQMIENLNRAGLRAFDGNAEKSAQFNKDLLLAARKKRKQKSSDPATT